MAAAGLTKEKRDRLTKFYDENIQPFIGEIAIEAPHFARRAVEFVSDVSMTRGAAEREGSSRSIARNAMRQHGSQELSMA